ncbi:two component transcriptional regulator, LytTR family [Ruminiclostridium papyrosolvens DSM 2782]|uniref:Stage 0 sporulation protein A homolog n=1 Tax=Ruminiclostridium papyrosolvens DSM 2782 TaxID=588581 RepID=F1T7Q0_9FIRM|nr:LytTR family DNA-binding domain-containing protein [Ruminiclostridium papyrosolvens]EGD49498.1 two component transcriptional regulator, LytTR family [Ruminiclostridium papyrosolvens DSM 2782]WES33377.1 LytTR family DNA-binding domain-containing protein [Ruminiclostridium papyrosolvens DSM 2782]
MKIAICDDLRFDRTLLCEYILQYAKNNFVNIEVVEFDSGEEMLTSFLEEKYKIVFLDIYMKGIDGVEVAEKIRETDEDCKIIFTTSSLDHKGEGFEVAATHYLIKPITYKRVEQALNRCKKILAFDAKYIELPLGKETVKIRLRDIMYIEAVRNGIVITTEIEEYKIHMPMAKICDIIKDKRFLRSHRGFIVNMQHIIATKENEFVLKNSFTIPIRQSGRKEIKCAYMHYVIESQKDNHCSDFIV